MCVVAEEKLIATAVETKIQATPFTNIVDQLKANMMVVTATSFYELIKVNSEAAEELPP